MYYVSPCCFVFLLVRLLPSNSVLLHRVAWLQPHSCGHRDVLSTLLLDISLASVTGANDIYESAPAICFC